MFFCYGWPFLLGVSFFVWQLSHPKRTTLVKRTISEHVWCKRITCCVRIFWTDFEHLYRRASSMSESLAIAPGIPLWKSDQMPCAFCLSKGCFASRCKKLQGGHWHRILLAEYGNNGRSTSQFPHSWSLSRPNAPSPAVPTPSEPALHNTWRLPWWNLALGRRQHMSSPIIVDGDKISFVHVWCIDHEEKMITCLQSFTIPCIDQKMNQQFTKVQLTATVRVSHLASKQGSKSKLRRAWEWHNKL